MNNKYWEIYARNIGTYSKEEQQKLKDSTVLVAGTGGLGAPSAIALARLGIGKLILADIDSYEYSNLNRQLPAGVNDVGRDKSQVVAEHITNILPHIEVEVITNGIIKSNSDELVKKSDVVLNAIDSFGTITLQKSMRKYNKIGFIANIIEHKVMASTMLSDGPLLSDIYPYKIDEENIDKTIEEYKLFLQALLKRDDLFSGGFVSVTCPGVFMAAGLVGYQIGNYIAKNKISIPPFPSHLVFDATTMSCSHQMKMLNVMRKNKAMNILFKKLFNYKVNQRLKKLNY